MTYEGWIGVGGVFDTHCLYLLLYPDGRFGRIGGMGCGDVFVWSVEVTSKKRTGGTTTRRDETNTHICSVVLGNAVTDQVFMEKCYSLEIVHAYVFVF